MRPPIRSNAAQCVRTCLVGGDPAHPQVVQAPVHGEFLARQSLFKIVPVGNYEGKPLCPELPA